MSNLATVPREVAVAPVTPMELIQRASAQGASIEQMQQLFELKLRVEADEARKAFHQAMAKFKQNPPRIYKNVTKKAGNIDLCYASLDNVVEVITPVLSAVSIRHRWEVKQDSALISVSCVLSHDLGHCEVTTLTAPADSSGSKNSIQAIASTVTYLQRYTLLAATGMAAAGMDDDAGTVAKKGMPDHELLEALDAIEGAAHLTELHSIYAAHYKEAQKYGDQSAMKQIIAAKDKAKAGLQ
jgi:hypothetical protein